MLILVINSDGSSAERELDESGSLAGQLAKLQEIVGGYVEALVGGTWAMYVNEDGIPDDLPVNPKATELAARLGWRTFLAKDGLLRGTAVFLGHEGSAETDVPQGVLELWRMIK